MASRLQIIQRIENNLKRLEPIDSKFRVFDICVVSFDLDAGVETLSRFFCDLDVCMSGRYLSDIACAGLQALWIFLYAHVEREIAG